MRDHTRRSLFVCDAPCLHASASRLATVWPLVLITPLPRLGQRPTSASRCPQAGHHVTASPCRGQMDGQRLARLTRPSTTCSTHRPTWSVSWCGFRHESSARLLNKRPQDPSCFLRSGRLETATAGTTTQAHASSSCNCPGLLSRSNNTTTSYRCCWDWQSNDQDAHNPVASWPLHCLLIAISLTISFRLSP